MKERSKEKSKEKSNIGKWCMAGTFIVAVGALCLVSFLMKDRKFSENENRYLAKMPGLSWEHVMDGSFQEEFEAYLNDQVCFRDGWITMKTALQKWSGDTDIGGAYLGKDGYDFEKIAPEDLDGKLLERNIRAVQKYFSYCREKGIDADRLEFLMVPTSGLVMEEMLPAHARLFDQSACIDRAAKALEEYNFIDVRDALADSKDAQLYYRTDHHWTSDGAFVALQQWSEATGRREPEPSEYEKETVTEEFRGSLYSKVLDYDSAYDAIWIYQKKKACKYAVKIDETTNMGGCFYNEEKLKEKDKYAFFFGGNYGEVHIRNKSQGKGNLLVVKDSFANTFVPMIAENYKNVYMVDLRYYKGDMKAYLEEHGITEVLVLYNISNFISDKNIFLLGR